MINHGKYMVELFRNSRKFPESFKDLRESSIRDYLLKYRNYFGSAMGVLGFMFYDLCKEYTDDKKRGEVGLNSYRLLLLIDIVDDIIDKRNSSLNEKFEFLDNVRSNLFGSNKTGRDLEERTSCRLAGLIYEDFISKYGELDLKEIMDKLTHSVKRQFTETNPQELFFIAKMTGSCCTLAVETLSEIVDSTNYPIARDAVKKIGEYAQLLDVLYEVNNDLTERVNTYATIRIKTEGDTKNVRNDIKNTILSSARNSFHEGLEILTEQRQKHIFKFIKNLLDIKYRIIARYRDNFNILNKDKQHFPILITKN